ncbi:Gti1/Pac2 family-domain-containing protein [Phakopsora pachyrhizi]|nr:Gti1/Pac2 family-domain-containing protein [Phakopsora pachyrhizi]
MNNQQQQQQHYHYNNHHHSQPQPQPHHQHHPHHQRPSSSSSSSSSSSAQHYHHHQQHQHHPHRPSPQVTSLQQSLPSSSSHNSHYQRHSLASSSNNINHLIPQSASKQILSSSNTSSSNLPTGISKPAISSAPIANAPSSSSSSSSSPTSSSYSHQLPLPPLQQPNQQHHSHQLISFSHPSSIPPNPSSINQSHLHPFSSSTASCNANPSSTIPGTNLTKPPPAASPTPSPTALTHHFPHPSLHHHSLFQQQPQSIQGTQTLHPFQPHPGSISDITQLRHHSLLAHHSSALGPGSLSASNNRINIDKYKSSATPAYHGFIQSTEDALLVFQACYEGACPKVTRRLHERERRSISSGSVYVFEEREAGIKRWTDGRVWSPSRILNNFLIYREIDQKRPNSTTNNNSGDDQSTSNLQENSTGNYNHPRSSDLDSGPDNALVQSTSRATNTSLGDIRMVDTKPLLGGSSQTPLSNNQNFTHQSSPPKSSDSSPIESNPNNASSSHLALNRDQERALVGSLTSTYKFREDGLVKKTISLAGMHMISYYKVDDVLSGRLRTPSQEPRSFSHIFKEEFLNPSNFRVPPVWDIDYNGIVVFRKELSEDGSNPSIQTSGSNEKAHNSTPESILSSSKSTAQFHPPSVRSSSSSVTPNSGQGLFPNNTSLSNPTSQHSGGSSLTSFRINSGSDVLPSCNPHQVTRPASSSSSASSPRLSPISPNTYSSISNNKHVSSLNNLNNPQSSAPVSRPSLNPHRISSPPSSAAHSASGGSGASRNILMAGGGVGSGSNSAIRYEPYARPNPSPPSLLAPVSAGNSSSSSPTFYHNSSHNSGGTFPPQSFFSDSQNSIPSLLNQPSSSNNRNSNNETAARTQENRNFDSMSNVNYESSGGVSYGNCGVCFFFFYESCICICIFFFIYNSV